MTDEENRFVEIRPAADDYRLAQAIIDYCLNPTEELYMLEETGDLLSLLGFGTMRLPLLLDGSGEVDEELVGRMVRYAASHGVNYYDTAYPYHNSKSEIIIGKAFKDYFTERCVTC